MPGNLTGAAESVSFPRPVRVAGRCFGVLLLAAIVFGWGYRALHDPVTADSGLAWSGGQLAWKTGHPETLFSWISTPFLGMIAAFASQTMSAYTFAKVITVVNITIMVLGGGWALLSLRRVLKPAWWWIVAVAMMGFPPMMSGVWFKNFEVIAIGAAIGGFACLRSGRRGWGAFLIGFSVAFKPMVILLPLVLVARRGTRRAGLEAIGWIIVLSVAGLVMYAIAAHSLAPLNPSITLHNFTSKSYNWACNQQNFAPGSTLCLYSGGPLWQSHTGQSIVDYGILVLLGSWVIDALRGQTSTNWEVFAFTLPLSAMTGPIAWSHYQIMLAPLFVLLVVRFSNLRATVGQWFGLLVAFVLASLMWQPYGTLTGEIHTVLGSGNHDVATLPTAESLGQFAQYVLLVTGIFWYLRRRGEAVVSGASTGSVSSRSPIAESGSETLAT